MIYIMKNKRINAERNEYILMDNEDLIQARIKAKPENAIRLKQKFDMQQVSPLDAWSMLSFKQVSTGMFFPLPF